MCLGPPAKQQNQTDGLKNYLQMQIQYIPAVDNSSHIWLPECIREGIGGTDGIGESGRGEVDDDNNCRTMGGKETQWDGHSIPYKLPV